LKIEIFPGGIFKTRNNHKRCNFNQHFDVCLSRNVHRKLHSYDYIKYFKNYYYTGCEGRNQKSSAEKFDNMVDGDSYLLGHRAMWTGKQMVTKITLRR
jgi:hypothetical protein